jgi:hypothetical protein
MWLSASKRTFGTVAAGIGDNSSSWIVLEGQGRKQVRHDSFRPGQTSPCGRPGLGRSHLTGQVGK